MQLSCSFQVKFAAVPKPARQVANANIKPGKCVNFQVSERAVCRGFSRASCTKPGSPNGPRSKYFETIRCYTFQRVLIIYSSQELEPCIGCMVNQADVKLQRRCLTEGVEPGENGACVTCYCRPMWCISCMGKWFASRQNQNRPDTWLGSKCPCPTCRSKFCILDVCPIQQL